MTEHKHATEIIIGAEMFSDFAMPNRYCDFCNNGYKTNPGAGYYKLTVKMKCALVMNTLPLEYVCGDHFDSSSFDKSGKLCPGSVPTFFPRRECVQLDHNYTTAVETDTGRTKDSFLYTY